MNIAKIDLLNGGSYIDMPFKCNTVINVENYNDDMCFIWNVIAYFYEVDGKLHLNRVIHYQVYFLLLLYGIDVCKKITPEWLKDNFNFNKPIYNKLQDMMKTVDPNTLYVHSQMLNLEGTNYPTTFKDIRKFEQQNPKIQINVYALKKKNHITQPPTVLTRKDYEVIPTDCITKIPNREFIIDLLYFEDNGHSPLIEGQGKKLTML